MEEVFALLCETGLATMAEIRDLNGPWSTGLMAAMALEARRIKAQREKRAYLGQVAAIATFLSKGEFSREYAASLDAVLNELEETAAKRRGEDVPTAAEKAADALEKILGGLPMKER